jgi:hypothetical protein
MTADIAALLDRAGAAALGPLRIASSAAENGGWDVAVTYGDQGAVSVRAQADAATGGLVLERAVSNDSDAARAFLDSRSWIAAVGPTAGGSAILKIWLHGDGLGMNLLLSALADLARLPAAFDEKGGPAATAEIEQTSPAEIALDRPPVEAPTPAPRGTSWMSLDPPAAPLGAPAGASAPETRSPIPAAEINGPAGARHVDTANAALTKTSADVGRPAAVDGFGTAGQTPAGQESSTSAPPPAQPVPETAVLPPAVGAAGTCRECGAPFAPDHAFCTTCGARLEAARKDP